jgi:hypothetical protein
VLVIYRGGPLPAALAGLLGFSFLKPQADRLTVAALGQRVQQLLRDISDGGI